MTTDKKINLIIKNFEWGKVQQAMKALNWTWWNSQGIPTIDQLSTAGEKLLHGVVDEKLQIVSTGGFVATRRVVDKEIFLELYFSVASWDA